MHVGEQPRSHVRMHPLQAPAGGAHGHAPAAPDARTHMRVHAQQRQRRKARSEAPGAGAGGVGAGERRLTRSFRYAARDGAAERWA
jgi:hypothetical protein